MTINELACRCGYFYNANDKHNVNNGYNCRHPECDEVQEGIGCCFTVSCPLAFPIDEEYCQDHGIDPDKYDENECVVVFDEQILKKLVEEKEE